MARKRRKRRNYNRFSFRISAIEISDEIKKDVLAIFLFALALISVLSFLGSAGELGERINLGLKFLFGYGFVIFPLVLIFWGLKLIKSEDFAESKTSFLGMVLMTISILTFVHTFYNIEVVFEIAKEGKGGGIIGAVLAWMMLSFMGKWGSLVIVFAMFLISLLLIFDISFADLLGRIRFTKKSEGENYKKNKLNKIESEEDDEDMDEEEYEEDEDEDEDEDTEIKINIAGKRQEKKGIFSSLSEKIKKNKNEPEFSVKALKESVKESELELNEEENDFDEESDTSEQKKRNWQIPPLSLLDGKDSDPTSGDIKGNSNMIKRTLSEFGIEVEMGEVNVGPTVTQYTLKPAVGIKLSKIISLQNDLALTLAARSLRIEAPIPGKSLIGIELPNQSVAMVRLKNMLDSSEFHNRKSSLNIVLGRDVSGSPILANLEKMPHLMIAGSTGSGKTVCINTLITGLLYQNTPDDLRFIMIDPKRVELTPYDDIPHLLTPVITDPDKAVNSLKWAIGEMEERYETLSQLGCRNIESYNNAVRTKYKQREVLPFIVIIVDELADLMVTNGREVEAAIVRLAQKSRAVGIHIVLSTQRPSVEVITGLIKANITNRIAFQVASQIDSRTILDMAGAEKLLGCGDMLFLSGDLNKPRRIQGVYISEEEVKEVSEFLGKQKEEDVEYDKAITENKKSLVNASSETDVVEDSLYDEAVELIRESNKASATFLQRKLRIGYSRAARLLDIMEDQGIVGPSRGAKPREIYVSSQDEHEDDSYDEAEE
ncbi:MAG: DNA translocase FtsK 4TM domain-containing protein [Candidatus Pacebacteria bacterium]|nr:DNA translocase FtsK 4TM domain-containing protein [Candidatus Paceibacterota bacterium]